jgi:hypothetical protein
MVSTPRPIFIFTGAGLAEGRVDEALVELEPVALPERTVLFGTNSKFVRQFSFTSVCSPCGNTAYVGVEDHGTLTDLKIGQAGCQHSVAKSERPHTGTPRRLASIVRP